MTAARRRLGIGVIGFGWMGHAHARSMLRIPTLFPERYFDPVLVLCSDTVAGRRDQARADFGFSGATSDWRQVVADPDVDVVVITAPNMLHVEVIEAAAAAAKPIFCEKPVGGTPAQTARAAKAARRAQVATGVGYNYRWAPLVQEASRLLGAGALGAITNYRGRFFSSYGADPMGTLSWRYRIEEGGYGASTDLLSHAVDLAQHLIGGITRVVGTAATFISERPLPVPGGGTHYDRGGETDARGAVTNEDYTGMLCVFDNGARGTFEASRSIVGPESQMAFEVYGTDGALAWNLERMNEMQLYLRSDGRHAGFRTILAGERFPHHGSFVPGNANAIGFEDLVTIEDYEFCRAVVEGRDHHPGFDDALACVSVQDALVRSWDSGGWEPVTQLGEVECAP